MNDKFKNICGNVLMIVARNNPTSNDYEWEVIPYYDSNRDRLYISFECNCVVTDHEFRAASGHLECYGSREGVDYYLQPYNVDADTIGPFHLVKDKSIDQFYVDLDFTMDFVMKKVIK